MSRKVRRLSGQAWLKEKTGSSLPAHVDGDEEANSLIAAVCAAFPEEIQSAVHFKPGWFVAAGRTGKHGRYVAFSDDEVDALRDKFVSIPIPAGGVVLWLGDTAHCNSNPANCPPFPVDDRSYSVSAVGIATIVRYLREFGHVVIRDVVPPEECASIVAGLIADHKWAANGNKPGPPGSNGCLICKCYALCYTNTAQKARLLPGVRHIFEGIYGTEELVLSADAYSLVVRDGGDFTAKDVIRCCSFVSWAPKAASCPKFAKAKVRRALTGGSMSHDPLKPRPMPPSGNLKPAWNHYSNKKEGGWRACTVLPAPEEGKKAPEYAILLPETLAAFGFSE